MPARSAPVGLMYLLGQGVPHDDAQAVAWYRKAADQGNGDGQFGLGLRYLEGRGVPKDKPQGIAWIRNAAEQGNAFAEFYLGIAYGVGDGVPQDFAQAATWHLSGCRPRGDGLAEHPRSNVPRRPRVPQDYIRAHMWFNWAAAGTLDASFHNKLAKDRDDVAAKMTPDQIVEAQRMASEWTSHPSRR